MHLRIMLLTLIAVAPSVPAFAQLRQMRQLPYSPTPPAGPAQEQFLDYPLHLRIIDARWNFDRRTGSYIGWGHADMLGDDREGVDYTYDCSAPFLPNQTHGEFYEARWKKPEAKLDILVQPIGSTHVSRCTLKVALKPARYAKDSVDWTNPTVPTAPAAPAPAARPTEPVLQRLPPPAPQAPPPTAPPTIR